LDSSSLKIVLKNLPSYSPVEKQMILLKGIMKVTKFLLPCLSLMH
jgi:hypothetical protein